MLFNLPNLFTLARILLAPVVAVDIAGGKYGRALILFFAAGWTDVIDGYLARRMGDSTPTGAYFDPLADKLLLTVVFLALGWAHAIAWWTVWLVFGRDLLILAMAGYGLMFTRIRKFPPSVWGKISTFFQISLACMVMGDKAGFPTPVTLATWLMVGTTAWSGLHYAWRGIQTLRAR